MSSEGGLPESNPPAYEATFRAALAAIAARSQIAQRLELGAAESVLRSIVAAAVAIFDAEAASLALYDPDRNMLVFRVAAGEQGDGVVGMEIRPDQGLAGYVFSSGQAVAISDVASDARFGRAFARATGYVPRSIVAVPLVDDEGTIGVLEVLDKRSQSAFSLRDVELAGVFALQATVAIRASRVERDTAALIRTVLTGLAGGDAPAAGVDALVAAALEGLGHDDDPLWPLVERIAAVRATSPEQLELVTALLGVLARQSARGRGGRTAKGGQSGSGRLGRWGSRPSGGEPASDD
ncbi:MAG: GAF domain-containing protein [Candidatus Limnocylindrales bacterium]